LNSTISALRNDFPIFENNPELIYLDNAASSQKPRQVIDRISRYYNREHANIHRGIYDLSEHATVAYEEVRKTVARFIGTDNPREVIFTSGTTDGMNFLSDSLGMNLKEGDEVLISEIEHHANIVPWHILAKQRNIVIRYLPLGNDGTPDTSRIDTLISNKTRIVSLSHCSNVLGRINNYDQVIRRAHEAGALVIFDAAQSVPHTPIDVRKLGCDFLVFSGHKMCGPTGTGVVWGRFDLLESLSPSKGGGDMIKSVWMDHSDWNEVPHRFEAGTPNIAGVIGLGEAVKYLESAGMDKIEEYIGTLAAYAWDRFSSFPGVKLLCEGTNASGIFSFYHPDIHSHDLSHILNKYHVCLRAGHHCAQPLHRKLGIVSSLRLSLYFYNTREELDRFFENLVKAVSFF
jgi:cysteine desulfurase / selenocysteine lyase